MTKEAFNKLVKPFRSEASNAQLTEILKFIILRNLSNVNTVKSPNSHIFVRSKKHWLFECVTIWVIEQNRIRGLDLRIKIWLKFDF